MKSKKGLRILNVLVAILLALGNALIGITPVFAADSVTAAATPSTTTPPNGGQVTVAINIDVTGVASPNSALGSYTGTLDWDPAVLAYDSNSGALGGFTGAVNTADVATGHIDFNGVNPSGALGNTIVLNVTFDVIAVGNSALNLGFSVMAAATTFTDLLPSLTVTDGLVAVPPISYIGNLGSGTQNLASNLTTTIAIPPTTSIQAGDAIIVAYTTDAAPDIPLSITDSWSASDTYQLSAMAVMAAQIRTYIFAAYNVSGLSAGSGNTITITETLPASGTQPQNRAAVAAVFRGLAPVGALEQSSNGPANNTAATGTSPNSGSISTVQPVQLLIGAVGTKGADVASPGTWSSGWIDGPIGGATGLNQTISMAYQVVSSAGSYTASKTIPTAHYWGATIASFKASTAGTISYIGDIGSTTNQSKTTGTSLPVQTTSEVAVGDDILVTFAADPSTNVATVTDLVGNTYNMIVDVTSTAHVRTTIFQAHVVTALPAGNPAITITHDSLTARSAVVSVFRGLASSAVLDQTKTASSTSAGTNASSGASSATTQADELLIGAIGTEGGHYDAPGTWSNAFSQGPRLGTGVGTTTNAATDITAAMGWKIVSATGAFIAQKQGIGSKPWTASLATFKMSTVDNTSPTVTINQTGGQADPTGTSPINFTVVFSEMVTDFATGDVTLSGSAGATTAVVTGSGTTYDVAVSGMTGPGTVIASIGAGVAHDAASNPNTSSTSIDNTVTYDNAVPTVTINQAVGQADPTNATTINFTVVFSEAVADFETGDVTLGGSAGATAAVVTGTGTTYNVAVSGMTGSGTVIATIAAGVAHDAAANPNTVSSSSDNTVTYDVVSPTVTIDQAVGQTDPTSASPINFTVVFSEPVTDFTTGDVTLSGTAGATNGTVSGSGTTYAVAVSGMSGSGTVIASIAAGVAHDAANNPNTVNTTTDNTVTYNLIITPLTVAINQAGAQVDPTNASPINFAVVFSETVTDFATGDVSLGGTAGATTGTVTGSGTTYNVAVSGMTGSGTVIVSIASGVAHDASANPNEASTSTDSTVAYDVVSPTVTINQAASQLDPTNASPIDFTVVFSETVTDFTTGDVILGGTAPGSLSGTVTGSGTTYNVAVSGMTGSGTVIASIAAGVAHDAANNSNTVGTSSDNTVAYDNVAPTVTINQAGGQADPTNASPINFTVVFSESVADFATGDVSLSGTAGATTGIVTGSGTTYNVAVSGMTGSGTVIASIAAGVAHDAAANPNVASTSSDNTVNLDITSPTVTINQAVGQVDPANTSPINFTVVFSKSVTDFATGDVILNGTAGATTGIVSGSGTTYAVAVSGMTGSGTVIASIAAGVAHDSIANPNTASTSTDNTVTYDNLAPTATVNQAASQDDPTNASPINYTVVFSETVTDFATGDVTLSGTATGTLTGIVSGTGTTYNVAVSGMTGSGTVIAGIAAGVAHDAANNSNTIGTSTDTTVTYDNVAPEVTINQAVSQQDPTNASPINFAVVFSEAVTDFTTGDVTLSGTAGATIAEVTGSGTTYNVAISGMTGSGTVIASIAAGVAHDAAANPNVASTSTDNTVTFEYVAPPISYIGDIGSATIKDSAVADLVVTTTSAVVAGDDILIAYATDPSQDLTVSVTDSVGNKYQQAAMGISVGNLRTYIFAAYDATPLPLGGTITIHQVVVSTTTVAARAAVVSVFRGLAPVGALEQSSVGAQSAGTTPSSGAATTVQPVQLLMGAVGTEGPSGDTAGTWENAFTVGARNGTTGGTADTNITVSMGWQIVSPAGSYTAAKSGITSRDSATAIATFKTTDAGISFIGDVGSAQTKASAGTSLVVTTNAAVAAGDDILVTFVADPAADVSSITDSAGNTYNQVIDIANGTNVRTFIYATYNVSPLPSGGTITINHASVTARAAVVSVFRGLANNAVVDQTKTATGTTSTVSSGATGTTTQADELLIGAVGLEGPNGDAPSVWQNSFSYGPRLGTNFGLTGGGDTDVTAQVGWRIVGATGAYTAQIITLNSARDWSASIATFKAAGEEITHTITASAGANGTIAPSGAVTVEQGEDQGFTIAPAAGYHVADVLVDGSTIGAVTSYTFTNVIANHTIAASFAINTYTITATTGSNGTITPSGAVIVSHGANPAFTIAPAAGYHVLDVQVDGSSVGAVTSYTFNNVIANHTIAASFAINTYTITASAGANGTITPSGPVTVDHGANLDFTITPAAGYHVADVLVDGSTVGAVTSYTFNNVIANHTIAASFAINTYTITASAGANGTINPTGAVIVNWGGDQGFTITPAAGYHVLDVLVDGSTVGVVTSYTFNNVIANHTIAASFAINTYTITASAGANGTINPTGAVIVNWGGDQGFTVTPATGYHVLDVLVDGSTVGAVTSYTFTSVTDNHTIAANFAINTYTITATAGASGSISPSGAVPVNYGASQAFTITPETGYHVVDVVVDTVSVGALTSYTFTNVTANHTIAASFAINPVENHAPVIAEGTSISVSMNKNGALKPFTLTLHATDGDGDTLTWSISSQAGHGIASASGTGPSKTIEYIPATNYIGTDSFVVQVSDGKGGIDTITVNVTILSTTFLPIIFK